MPKYFVENEKTQKGEALSIDTSKDGYNAGIQAMAWLGMAELADYEPVEVKAYCGGSTPKTITLYPPVGNLER